MQDTPTQKQKREIKMSDKQKLEVGDVVVLSSHPENKMIGARVNDDKGSIVVALINTVAPYE